ncbi:hypothetical protein HY448_01990 [Candidatus Pacearchaeota archaeon]|nr:hypothetical protein [Candidatus Pacearchaeota archaeon]
MTRYEIKCNGEGALKKLGDLFNDVHLEIGNIAHLQKVRYFNARRGNPNAEDAHASYVLARPNPIVVVKVNGIKWLYEKSGAISVDVKHIDENQKIQDLEEILNHYGFGSTGTTNHFAKRR